MAVAAHGIHVEKVGQRKLARAELQTLYGHTFEHAERPDVLIISLVTQREHISKECARHVWGRAQWRSLTGDTDNVNVRVTRQTQRVADAVPAGFFQIKDDVTRIRQPQRRVKSENARGANLAFLVQALRS